MYLDTSRGSARSADSVPGVRSPVELTHAFRTRGLKLTPQRQLLFKLLHENTTHPTADSLFAVATDQMPGISLRTVYQTLNDLTEMGELQSFDFDGSATRFDPNIDAHHHVVCRICAQVADVYVGGTADLRLDGLEGFVVDRSDIVFHGVCAACAVSAAHPNDFPPPPEHPTQGDAR